MLKSTLSGQSAYLSPAGTHHRLFIALLILPSFHSQPCLMHTGPTGPCEASTAPHATQRTSKSSSIESHARILCVCYICKASAHDGSMVVAPFLIVECIICNFLFVLCGCVLYIKSSHSCARAGRRLCYFYEYDGQSSIALGPASPCYTTVNHAQHKNVGYCSPFAVPRASTLYKGVQLSGGEYRRYAMIPACVPTR